MVKGDVGTLRLVYDFSLRHTFRDLWRRRRLALSTCYITQHASSLSSSSPPLSLIHWRECVCVRDSYYSPIYRWYVCCCCLMMMSSAAFSQFSVAHSSFSRIVSLALNGAMCVAFAVSLLLLGFFFVVSFAQLRSALHVAFCTEHLYSCV